MLKQGDYEMWRLRIEQYFQVQDYALSDVIENGNSFKPGAQTTTNDAGTSTTLITGYVTTKENAQKKNNVKARSMLLMALPNVHLMTFNQYKDAKSLFVAIETRFGGNEATKKIHKSLLKQTYENFSVKSTESLDSIFNRLQKIVSQLAVLDTMIIDDLYNNFKIVEQEVKGTASSNSSSQDMAFVSYPSTNSTNEIYSAYGKTRKKITINGSDITGFDKSKVECYNCHKMGHFATECKGPRNQDSRNGYQDSSKRNVQVEETPPKAMVAIDGVGFYWSFMEDAEVLANMALMAFSDSEIHNEKTWSQIPDNSKKGLAYESYHAVPPPPTGLFSSPKLDLSNSGLEEFKQLEFDGYGPKTNNKDCLVESPVVVEKKADVPTIAKVGVVRPKQQEKPVRKPVKYAKMYRSQGPRGNQRNWNNQKSQKLKSNFVMYNKAFFACGSFKHVQANCNYHQRERVVSGNNNTRVNYNNSTRKTHPNAHRNIAPRAVLMKTGLRPLNTARPVNTTHPKTTVYSARPMPRAVNTARLRLVNTARPRLVNTARPNSAVVNVVWVNQVKQSSMVGFDKHATITSNDPLSGEDRLKLTELMKLCTQLHSRALVLETTKANQALEIKCLKRRVKKLKKKASKKTHKLKRLYKIGSSKRVESSEDTGVALVNETQGRNDQDMFDTSVLDDEEVVAEKDVSTADPVTTDDEEVTTVGVEVSTAAITSQISMDDITLAKALIDIKTSKPKAKRIVIQEPFQTPIPTQIDSSQQSSKAKDKGNAKMIEPEQPLKRKDQIMIDEKVARNLEACIGCQKS
uniref:Ribonuclease H-like domain-containing protein n=1 Tax=Tanacetum cinerariifolium TaxID=118510 RepID=A0A6L2KVC3_TANCI|nr:ribonuclease H-like domain-containing protein [Tanacetum cinerariifolium]